MPLGWLILLQGVAALLIRYDWGYGVLRGTILVVLLVLLVLLHLKPSALVAITSLPKWLGLLLTLAFAADLCAAGAATVQSLRTYQIPLDEGQTTWTAAELLLKGENPYGTGALVDRMAYMLRLPERIDAGVGPRLPAPLLSSAFRRYERTLDPALHEDLLPLSSQAGGEAARETRLTGYKYGPVILLLSIPIVWLGVPAAMVATNAALALALSATMWLILRGVAGSATGLAALGLAALLLDPPIVWNFMENTATDVWSLLFCALAILAFGRKRSSLMSVALAAAVGCKLFPSLLLVPLLLRWRSVRPIAIFLLATVAIYLPFLIWDARGLIDNVFLWPLYTTPDDTSWLYGAPPAVAIAVRAIAFAAIAVLIARFLLDRETRLFWTLSLASILLILSGRAMHNNYIPWASIWWVTAVVEKFSEKSDLGQRLRQA